MESLVVLGRTRALVDDFGEIIYAVQPLSFLNTAKALRGYRAEPVSTF